MPHWLKIGNDLTNLDNVTLIRLNPDGSVCVYVTASISPDGHPWGNRYEGEDALKLRQDLFGIQYGRPYWSEDNTKLLRDFGLGDPCAACESEPEPPF